MSSGQVSYPLLTLFATPKAFRGQTELIQRNAISSWIALRPRVDVALMGNEFGTRAVAHELGARHFPELQANEHGTPLLSSAFEIANSKLRSPLLAYCNSDVILLSDFASAAERLLVSDELTDFLAIGRRTDLQISQPIDFNEPDEVQSLIDRCQRSGRVAPIVCKEYFIFRRNQFAEIPPFCVGRGNWDNWMVYAAKRKGIPVVGLTDCVVVIHQVHDYSHRKETRLELYATGEEARANERFAGGKHLISGSTSDWRLDRDGLRRRSMSFMNGEFWADFPRFAKLLADLVASRK